MPLSLPGALAAVVADLVTGAVTVTTAAGETLAAGNVTPGTRAWLDEWGRVVIESPTGEQTRVGNVAGAPSDPVFRGGGVVNGTPLGGAAELKLGRRWAAAVTTDATGLAVVQLPAGLLADVWSVHADVAGPVTVGGTPAAALAALTEVSASRVSLQVWTATGVLLGGGTMAKPSAAVRVLLEVCGSVPAP